MAYKLTKEALILDLYSAFYCAKIHKSSKFYVKTFEARLKDNIESLANDLWNRTYKPQPSSCFIVESPKKREIFAAQFRDRVVHHLYFNYTHEIFERTFIQDTYSCIQGRGTHYGADRLEKHIKASSENYTIPCYILKLDIRGYFMHISRKLLLDIATNSLCKIAKHRVERHGKLLLEDVRDMDFILWLTKKIILLNPKENCKIVGAEKDWNGLDRNKSLFYTGDGLGLPIGNLTSQLFSNVYLNIFDQFMKRTLHCRYYGRYVDDAYVVSTDKDFLYSIVPKARKFLKETLGLDLHMGKVEIHDAKYGVEFLGAFVKPFRKYMANESLSRSIKRINGIKTHDIGETYRSVNSFLGTLMHYSSYNIRCNLFLSEKFLSIAPFDKGITKMMKPLQIS